jgi:hypothetical protein
MLSNKVFIWVSLQKKRLILVKALFFYPKIIVGLKNLADIDRPKFYSGYIKKLLRRKLDISKNQAEILTKVESMSKLDRALPEKLGFRKPRSLSTEDFCNQRRSINRE